MTQIKISTSIQQLQTIAIVEDEQILREELTFQLQHFGFSVAAFETAAELYRYLAGRRNVIAVLDIGLVGEDGISICENLRANDSQIGIVFITARGQQEDKLLGLSAGADAYLVKPIDINELVLHLNRLSQRAANTASIQPITQWQLNARDWMLTSPEGLSLMLTAKEHQFIKRLIEASGDIVAKAEFIESFFGPRATNGDERLEVMVSRLRSKSRETLGQAIPIKTAHGAGYAFGATAVISN